MVTLSKTSPLFIRRLTAAGMHSVLLCCIGWEQARNKKQHFENKDDKASQQRHHIRVHAMSQLLDQNKLRVVEIESGSDATYEHGLLLLQLLLLLHLLFISQQQDLLLLKLSSHHVHLLIDFGE